MNDYYDCACGCGDCSSCDVGCGDDGVKCPDGECLGSTGRRPPAPKPLDPDPEPRKPKKKIRILLTPEQWSKQTGVYIQDADGWHAGVNGYPGRKMWNEPITEAEFHARAAVSTVFIRKEVS